MVCSIGGTKWIGYEELQLGDILYNTAYFEYVDKGSSFASCFLGTLWMLGHKFAETSVRVNVRLVFHHITCISAILSLFPFLPEPRPWEFMIACS